MGSRIGFMQSEGIGDIVIALPIARHFLDQGHEIVWPVNDRFCGFLARAVPRVRWLPVDGTLRDTQPVRFFYEDPKTLLEQAGCDRVHVLYSKLAVPGLEVVNRGLAQSLKFDEYKYAVTGVPFHLKWTLEIERDLARETALFDSLGITGPYICVHRQGHDHKFEFALPDEWKRDYQIVEIGPRTDSPFDWIYTLEGAARLLLLDSCFSNLVEQLNLPNEKYLVLRSYMEATPVMKNGWQFVAIG